ncbi:MAG TPA: LamG-like jellyroll fold domain-containing protein [Sedimentisphaerales bacterium]|nr:LamG-like jellyroll fold domain-containing protein [Sedimentisphaerales bacterium]
MGRNIYRIQLLVIVAIMLWVGNLVAGEKPVGNGLVAFWGFDGNCHDLAGSVNDNLTAVGANARYIAADQLPATSGGAIALGVNSTDIQYLTTPLSEDLKLGATYTIEMWIYPTQVGGWNRLVLNWTVPPQYAYHAGIHNGLLSLYHGQSNGKYKFAEGGMVATGRWHHIAAVAARNENDPDNSQIRVYLNGKLTGTATFDGTIGQYSDMVTIGALTGNQFHGYLDDLAIWNRPLDEAEIQAHYNKRTEIITQLEVIRRKQQASLRKDLLIRFGIKNLPEIVFAERYPGRDPQRHYYADFGYACTDENEWLHGADGARLCRLNPESGKLTVLLEDQGGGIRDPQVSYDAKRILFSYRKEGTHHYNLYEINIDGSDLRQITSGNWDDIEPCYLPDGGIVFCSSRCKRYVVCWIAPVAVLFRCNIDGSDIQMLSSGAVTENTPSVLPDGRILYTRWEYVNRDAISFHHLWTMNPDGTNQQVYYGNQTPGGVFIDAKPIKENRQVVFIDSGYHGSHEHTGKVMVVSESNGPDSTKQLKQISPKDKWGYRDPFPVTPKAFLVAHNNKILLMDDSGKTMELYSGGQMVHEPRLLQPRESERSVFSQVDMSKDSGTLYVKDVYEGRKMQNVKRGSIKKILVMEQLPKPVNYHGGGSTPIAHGGTWTLKRILGTVPVAEDGSAYFEVPAVRSIYLALLDEHDRSVKQMRSFVTLRPGEQRGCIGCHENRTQSPSPGQRPKALLFKPQRIEPVKGVPEIFDFPRDIQPILDRHCVSCHNAGKRDGGIVLTGHRSTTYSLAYYNLLLHHQIIDGAGYRWEGIKNVGGRPIGNDTPYTMYSYASPLMDKIEPSHHSVNLSDHEKTMIRLWIDTSAQYAGTYAAYGTGQIGGWWRSNQPIREMADTWPTTPVVSKTINSRCGSCHGKMLPRFVTDQIPVDEYGDLEGWQRPTSRFSRHTVFDLTQPEKSLILMAPLDRNVGGYAEGLPQSTKLITEDRSKSPKPVIHPVIFASTDDPDYQNILDHLRAAQVRLNEIKRFDMPGFKPRREYVREMKRYGVLSDSFDLNSNIIDVYAIDKAYFKLFWHKPVDESGTK